LVRHTFQQVYIMWFLFLIRQKNSGSYKVDLITGVKYKGGWFLPLTKINKLTIDC
jgi:hypothetical protein